MQTRQIHGYTIDEHPNPESVYDWIRDNWHDLGQFTVDETVCSLKAFAEYFGVEIDYCIGIVPDRGEYIRFQFTGDRIGMLDSDIAGLSGNRLRTYIVNNFPKYSDCCPFTGVCYDETLLDNIRSFVAKPDSRNFKELLQDCGNAMFSVLHNEGKYIYSNEGLRETCEANEYLFTESGGIF